MRSMIVAVWLVAFAALSSSAVLAQDTAAGEKLYTVQKCSMCHSIGGKGNPAGKLDDVGSRLSEEDIRQWLINTRVMTEKAKSTRKPVMPAYTKLTKEEVDSLVAYLKSLKKK